MAQEAWDNVAQQEATALALMLAGERRCVMVVVIAADEDESGTIHICHGVGGDTRGKHLRQFIIGLQHKLDWLQAKLRRKVA